MEAHCGEGGHFLSTSPCRYSCHRPCPLNQGSQIGATRAETGRWSIPAALHSQFPQHPRSLTMIFDRVSPSPGFTQPASPKRPSKAVGLQEASLQRGMWVGAASPADGSGLTSGRELCRDGGGGIGSGASVLTKLNPEPRRLGLTRARADAMRFTVRSVSGG